MNNYQSANRNASEDSYKVANNIINQLANVKPSNKANTMKTYTNMQLMKANFPIGHTFNYEGNEVTVIDYENGDANPVAVLSVEFSQSNKDAMINLGLHRPAILKMSYNALVIAEARG